MVTTSITLYTINSIIYIMIGVLHTYAHYKDLETPEIADKLGFETMVMGQDAQVYKLWQGMSLMMGFLLIIVGLLNLQIIFGLDSGAYPPIGASLIIIAALLCVIYAGVKFFGKFQVYGGIFGIILQLSVLVISILQL